MYSGATPSDTVHVVPVPVECINSSSLKLSTDDDKDEVKNPSFLHASSYLASSCTISFAFSYAMKPKLMQKSDASKSNTLEYDGVSVGRIAYISCCEHFVSVFIEKKERRNINIKKRAKMDRKSVDIFSKLNGRKRDDLKASRRERPHKTTVRLTLGFVVRRRAHLLKTCLYCVRLLVCIMLYNGDF